MRSIAREPGFFASGLGHAALLVAGLASLWWPNAFPPAEEGVPVEIITEQQFNEITKGDKAAKEAAAVPKPRVDRIAEVKRDNDPGEAKQDVAAKPQPEPPPPPEPRLEIKPPAQAVAAPPPLPVPRPEPPKPEKEPLEKEAEIIKQAALTPPKKDPEPPKPEPPKADTKALQQAIEKDVELEKKKAEDAKRLAEEKRAEAKRKVEEKAKQQAEAKKLEQAIRDRLLLSKEAAQASGATGAEVNRTASLGARDATGRRLSPSDLATIGAMMREQIEKCWSITGAVPTVKPRVRFQLGPNGEVVGGPTLINTSGEPNFRSFAESGMRAIRACAPYRIPARFADRYQEWKDITVNLNPEEFL